MTGQYELNVEWAEYVRRFVDQAPPLTPAQFDRLAALLRSSKNAPRKKTKDDAA